MSRRNYTAYNHDINTLPGVHHYGFKCSAERIGAKMYEFRQKLMACGRVYDIQNVETTKTTGSFTDTYITYKVFA